MSSQRFQRKLWDLANSCKSGSVQWNKGGDVIIFDFTLFKKEFLDHTDKFCKSNKIASFVRQLNLYGFKKVSYSRRSRKRDVHEFKHPWFARDKEDWLQYVTRNCVLSKIGKKEMPRRRRRMKKKSSQKGRAINASSKAGQRGRPRKSEQCNIKSGESDHYYEKRSLSGSEMKKLEPLPILASRVPPKNETENLLKKSSIDPYSQSKAVEFPDIKNMFSNEKNSEEEKAQELHIDYEPKCNGFMPWKNGIVALSKYPTSLNQEQYSLPIYRCFQNQENEEPPIHKTLVPAVQPSMQWGWNMGSEFQSENISKGIGESKQVNLKTTFTKELPLAPAHPKTTNWEIKATVDENQHVMLKIENSFTTRTNTLDKGNNYKTKFTIQNGHISKQLLPTGRIETLQPCVRSALSTKVENITVKNINEYTTLQPCIRNVLSTNTANIVAPNSNEYTVLQTCVKNALPANKVVSNSNRYTTLQPCIRNALSTNGANISASSSNNYSRVNQMYNVVEETKVYKPYSLYESDCYVTQEFLDIREAYFRHYPERRPRFDGPDLRIYR